MRAATINQEALSSSRLATDVDRYRRRYTMTEITSNEHILIDFVAPKIICFEDYRFSLLQNSTTEFLESKYYYRPDYLSYDKYGTTNLWNLLLFINDIPNIEEFKVDQVLVPTKSIINKISTDIIRRNPSEELVPLKEIFIPEIQKLFYYYESMPRLIKPIDYVQSLISTSLYFYKELFDIEILTTRQRYVDLKFNPVIESMQFKIDNQPTFIYNKHYTIIKNDGKFNRLTWDPKKIPNGIGLVDIISSGMLLQVQYARKIT